MSKCTSVFKSAMFIIAVINTASTLVQASVATTNECPGTVAGYQCVLNQYEMVSRDQQLGSSFLGTKAGQDLKRATVLYMFRSSASPAGSIFKISSNEATKLPQESLQAIQYALSKLPNTFVGERQFISQFVSTLNVSKNEKFRIFSGELLRADVSDHSQESANTARLIAMERGHEVSPSQAEFEQVMDQSMRLHPAHDDKAVILKHYYRFDEGAAKRLAHKHSVRLPIRKPIAEPKPR